MLSSIGVRCMHRRRVGGTGEARYAGNSASNSSTATVAIVYHGMARGNIMFARDMPESCGREMFPVHT